MVRDKSKSSYASMEYRCIKTAAMTYFEHTEKLEFLKHLAEHKQAGTPRDLAKKLHTSERTVLRMVQQLREHGYPIAYNRFRYTYEMKGV